MGLARARPADDLGAVLEAQQGDRALLLAGEGVALGGDLLREQLVVLDRPMGAAQHPHRVLALRGVQRRVGGAGEGAQGAHDAVGEMRQVGRVQGDRARGLGRVPLPGQLGVGEDREVHGAADGAGGGGVEVVHEVVLGPLGLVDRGARQLPGAGAVGLPPPALVEGDPPALDLDHRDPDARPQHDQVRLDLLAARGDALAGDQHRLRGQLSDQRLPHGLLGGARETGLLGKGARHGAPRAVAASSLVAPG
jgi:hypothetical protein